MNDINYNEIYNNYIFIDEAGRGCAGGEMIFTGVKITGNVDCANDSKKTTFKQRDELVNKIKSNVIHCSIITTAEEIDKIGLSKAIKKSLESIIEYFGENEKYLYDGNKTFGVENKNLETLVKADVLVKGVGAASIIAKHLKDQLMLAHHEEFPMYGFSNNFGYITKSHVQAIKEYGYCKYHRHSYKIKELEDFKNKQSTDLLF